MWRVVTTSWTAEFSHTEDKGKAYVSDLLCPNVFLVWITVLFISIS